MGILILGGLLTAAAAGLLSIVVGIVDYVETGRRPRVLGGLLVILTAVFLLGVVACKGAQHRKRNGRAPPDSTWRFKSARPPVLGK